MFRHCVKLVIRKTNQYGGAQPLSPSTKVLTPIGDNNYSLQNNSGAQSLSTSTKVLTPIGDNNYSLQNNSGAHSLSPSTKVLTPIGDNNYALQNNSGAHYLSPSTTTSTVNPPQRNAKSHVFMISYLTTISVLVITLIKIT